ncbi:MAG: hypothetical protein IJ545_04295 [Alphaproteobacteria bacterium]|nr:hypothetical protein [Alphaproteobacteria bacterium]
MKKVLLFMQLMVLIAILLQMLSRKKQQKSRSARSKPSSGSGKMPEIIPHAVVHSSKMVPAPIVSPPKRMPEIIPVSVVSKKVNPERPKKPKGCFTLDQFRYIKAGMYWLEGNYFSSKPVSGFKVLALVLSVGAGKILAWMLEEETLVFNINRSYEEYDPQMLADTPSYSLIKRAAKAEDLASAKNLLTVLRKQQAQINASEIAGLYWEWKYDLPYSRCNIETGEKLPVIDAAKFRWILELQKK